MSRGVQVPWLAREPVSGPAVTLLVLFFLASSGVLDSRPPDTTSRALCMIGKFEEVGSLRAQGYDHTVEDVGGPKIREQDPVGPLAFRTLLGRGLPAPRAPDLH